jgi:hypothetical protein
MNFSRLSIYILLIALGFFAVYMFFSNNQILDNYDIDKSREVIGNLKSYEKEETKRKIYFNLTLDNYENVFIIPSPEWTSFDYQSFKNNVTIGDRLTLYIEPNQSVNNEPINIFQIRHNSSDFIDFEKKVIKRKTEKWMSLLFAILCLIGIVHHYKRPWI